MQKRYMIDELLNLVLEINNKTLFEATFNFMGHSDCVEIFIHELDGGKLRNIYFSNSIYFGDSLKALGEKRFAEAKEFLTKFLEEKSKEVEVQNGK